MPAPRDPASQAPVTGPAGPGMAKPQALGEGEFAEGGPRRGWGHAVLRDQAARVALIRATKASLATASGAVASGVSMGVRVRTRWVRRRKAVQFMLFTFLDGSHTEGTYLEYVADQSYANLTCPDAA